MSKFPCPDTERLQYIALVIIFLGAIVSFIVIINFGHKLDTELQDLDNIAKSNSQITEQIKIEEASLKAQNDQDTKYLECLINLNMVNTAPNPLGCVPPPPSTIIQPQPIIVPVPAPVPTTRGKKG